MNSSVYMARDFKLTRNSLMIARNQFEIERKTFEFNNPTCGGRTKKIYNNKQ